MTRVLACPNCGAHLERDKVRKGRARCTYCGAELDLPGREPDEKVDASFFEEAGAPVPGVPSPPPAGRRRSGASLRIMLSILIAIAIAGIAAYFMVASRPAPAPSRGDEAGAMEALLKPGDKVAKVSEPKAFLEGGAPVCPVDANGDDVMDLAVLVRLVEEGREERLQVRTIDGGTGKPIEVGQPFEKSPKFTYFCLGERGSGYQTPDLELHVFDAKDLEAGPVLQLPDEIARVAATDDCVRLRTLDGSTVGIDLATGKESDCKASPYERLDETPGMPFFKSTRTFTDGSSSFTIAARRQGTPFLEATCRKGRKELWRNELRIKATDFGVPALLGGSTLAVIGAEHAKESSALLVGLDRATGEERFEVVLEGTSVAVFGAAFWDNGRYLVVASSGGVFAYDPISGEKAWGL